MGDIEMSTKHGLSRSLKRIDTLALSFGAMIGWSWVALVGDVIARGGTGGAMIATAGVGIIIIALGMIYGELASAMPEVGGEHVYALRALGPMASFVCTWAIVFCYISVDAFEAIALPTVLENLFPSLGRMPLWTVNDAVVYLDHALIGASASIFLTVINIRGVKIAAFLQAVVVAMIILAGLVLFAGMGLSGDVDNMQPLFSNGTIGIFAAAAMIPFFMVGFDVIPQAAEEIDLPPRRIGLLVIWSIVAAVIWYMLIELAAGMLLNSSERLAADLNTIEAARVAWGQKGAVLLMLAGVAGIMTSWNSFLIAGSRALFALAESGMAPRFFARVHTRYKTPIGALVFCGLAGAIAPFLGRQALVWFVDAGSFALMIAYVFVALSFIILRRREPEMKRPYKAPFGQALGWFGLLASLALGALYLPGMPAALIWPQEWALVLTGLILGAVVYFTSSSAKNKG